MYTNHRPTTKLRSAISLAVLVGMSLLAGCGRFLYQALPPSPPQTLTVNPAMLPLANADFIWQQVVDTVDDYFRIRYEQPLNGLEGKLETNYQVGATILEPWRRDSTNGFERLQSTLQSIRRKADVTVYRREGGYSVEVVVRKEIEDVDQSQGESEGSIATRHDGTVTRTDEIFNGEPITLGWIPLERDTGLEQVILNDIINRITQPDKKSLLHH